MNNNFNANELETTINNLDSLRHGIYMLPNAVRAIPNGPNSSESASDDIVRLIESEDSDLANTWRNTIDISREIQTKAKKLLDRIEEELTKYMKETIRNEYNASEAISSINGSLESNKEALSQLEF